MNPNQVVVTLNLSLDQINMVIGGLAKLPYEQVAELVTGIRAAALNTLKEAEEKAKADAQQESAEQVQDTAIED